MNKFETTITSIRNILRIEGITGLDSINHCVALLVSRYLTINKCLEFQIPLEFAFENFLLDENKLPIDDQTAIGKFYNKNAEIDCLYCYLHDKLNFNSFKFKINAPLNFLNIYKKLADINIDSLSNMIDIVGAIYELHLKTGTTGSGMRDLGQYFTNREVIKYMIGLCNPRLKSNGDIETILDPSMGTGGFLSMSIKYLNKNHSDINWDINKDRIYGFDVDETVKDLSILNALLETGKIFNKTFVKNDTLHNDYMISNNVLIDKVDIILANEPFGLKNIIHKNVCKRIKDLKIDGTKAEPLFLQLMMQSLNEGGRCAVIVPDGVLFNDAKLHKLTRKYLCNNLRLSKVISLDNGLFLNTGVKSSILFFVNDGKTTDVEFCKIKLSNNEILEDSIIRVDIDRIILNDYSFAINKYTKKEIQQLNTIEYKKIEDICEILNGYAFKTEDYDNEGTINLITIKNINETININNCNKLKYNAKYNKYLIKNEDILMSLTGNIKIGVYNLDTESYLNQRVIKFYNYNKIVDKKYMYYYIKYFLIELIQQQTNGSVQGNISSNEIKNFKIPIPDLQIQHQIIQSLDIIYNTIENNLKLITNYQQIKKNIINSNTINAIKKNLGEITVFEQKIKKLKASDSFENGKYKFYTSSSKVGYRDDYEFKDYKIIIGRGGNSCIFYDKEFGISHDDIFVIGYLNTSLAYIYNYILSNFDILYEILTGSTIKHINKENLINIKISIPTIDIQEYIVSECDHYDNLIKTLQVENIKLQNNKIINRTLESIQINEQKDEQIELPIKKKKSLIKI